MVRVQQAPIPEDGDCFARHSRQHSPTENVLVRLKAAAVFVSEDSPDGNDNRRHSGRDSDHHHVLVVLFGLCGRLFGLDLVKSSRVLVVVIAVGVVVVIGQQADPIWLLTSSIADAT